MPAWTRAPALANCLRVPSSVTLSMRRFNVEEARQAQANSWPESMRHASVKRRAEFAAGRVCARQALKAGGYFGPSLLPPDARGLPTWPDGWVGSISHTDGIAVAAVDHRDNCDALGVDIERLLDDQACNEIQAIVASPSELILLNPLSRNHALTLLFSAKEALYKALFPNVGRFFDFSAAIATDWRPDVLTLSLAVHWSSRWKQGAEIRATYAFHDDHVLTMVWAS